ncbi:hypothetical protein FA13DRAFT_1723884 [Coprinellus micaceus]|uniref:F-box domain-containing protein n=1 Tax=Coprinellus micaceus TaxID=71717 RepID=A0A4Y7U1F0_COPMI|nr:hypothetical protein FA13DRAFT_1723884 [Coprinellus micaceus]
MDLKTLRAILRTNGLSSPRHRHLMRERAKELEEESQDWSRKTRGHRGKKLRALATEENLWTSAFAPIPLGSRPTPDLPPQHIRHILCQVCKHWRVVAAETRHLWQHHVVFHDIWHPFIRAKGLLRSEGLPTVAELYCRNLTHVHFDFSGVASSPNSTDILSTIAQHQEQYVSLRLVGTAEIIGLSVPGRRRRRAHHSMSSDEEELLIAITSPKEGHSIDFRAPRLKKLTLLESTLPRIPHADLESVLPFHQFIDALPRLLSHLRLIALEVADPPIDNSTRHITLSRLQVLEIHHPGRDSQDRERYGLRILRHITAPSLKTFDIIFTGRCVQSSEAGYIRVALCPPRWLSNVKAVRQHRLGYFQESPTRAWAMQCIDVVSVDRFIDRFLKRRDPCFGTNTLTLECGEDAKPLSGSEYSFLRSASSLLETGSFFPLGLSEGVTDGDRELYLVY